MYCPSCRSHYIALLGPRHTGNPHHLKCRRCGDIWENIEVREFRSISLLKYLMIDTFGG